MNSTDKDSKLLFALNKPKGYLVTRSDDLGRKTVYDLLPGWVYEDGWMPIGRLDLESKGLLLFTQDGQINNSKHSRTKDRAAKNIVEQKIVAKNEKIRGVEKAETKATRFQISRTIV